MAPDNKLPAILFGGLILMGLLVAAAWIMGESEGAQTSGNWAIRHPTFESMEHGGSGQRRSGSVFVLGCGIGFLQLIVFVSCLILGMPKGGEAGVAARPLWFAGLAWIAVWAGLFSSYYPYMRNAGGDQVLGLPAPSAWMLYGAWPFPVLFALYFIYMFSAWFLREDDLSRYRQLLEERGAGHPEGRE